MHSSLSVTILSVVLLMNYGQFVEGSICSNPQSYAGKVVKDPFGGQAGQCVSFVKTCTGDKRPTSSWKRGALVKGSNLPSGTAIATFPGGTYSGHAAIYVGQNKDGIQVWDQWVGQTVHARTIYWNGAKLSNNGNSFYVIE